ncbi:RNA polymerase sigma-70 factor (ECF subfamily) [Microbacterium sp. AK009]|uniref:RNA polymerase sigma factor n=1 Tax=Microbacterium sp. AK009 TaxID=2723068 RepID=UPI0015CD9B1D|nr:sigma-70 family RNA polymerase sigma factor [Microbacterium sp. AK009]NYF16504.1 RNA polymerase sigma-70 factor (ECF subfamily) [Microbacterium sp. AK009]
MGSVTTRTAAFDELVRQNEDDLSRYFQRRLLDSEDAAEAFGELLLTAWKLRRRIPADQTEARMWLFVTARNVMLNSRRTVARRSAAVQRLADEMRATAPTFAIDDVSTELRGAIAALPADDAELVRLVYWDGLPSHEAAAVLGINPSTARSRLAKTRKQLRAALGEADPDGQPPHD